MPACIIVSPFGVHTDSFPGGTHFIREKVRFGPLSDEHKAKIVDYLDVVGEEVLSRRVRRKPAFVVPYNDLAPFRALADLSAKADFALQLHQFSMEYFSSARAPMVAFAFDGDRVGSHAFDPYDLRFPEVDEIPLSQGVWEKHVTYLDFLYGSVHQAPLAKLVMTRLSRAYRQGPNSDGIIDLAIGLECLVIAQLEVKFQFSLYHALLNCDAVQDRSEIFGTLQTLYDVRSFTVHGTSPGKAEVRKSETVRQNWGRLMDVARANFTYYLVYCNREDPSTWQDHLRRLALGEPRRTGQ